MATVHLPKTEKIMAIGSRCSEQDHSFKISNLRKDRELWTMVFGKKCQKKIIASGYLKMPWWLTSRRKRRENMMQKRFAPGQNSWHWWFLHHRLGATNSRKVVDKETSLPKYRHSLFSTRESISSWMSRWQGNLAQLYWKIWNKIFFCESYISRRQVWRGKIQTRRSVNSSNRTAN